MKKFFITLFILAVLGGGVFFAGWAQLRLVRGTYGLVRSKTHGIDPRLVSPGELRWIWYFLIPANAEVVPLRLEPVSHTISVKNTLPSGNAYAAFAGTPADFSWELNGTLSFSIAPEKLGALAREHNIGSQEELDAFEKSAAEKIETYLLQRFDPETLGPEQLEELLKSGSYPALEQEIRGQFPFAGGCSLVIKNVRFPDFALYNQVRGLYEEFIARQREYTSSVLKPKAAERIESLLRLSELERYGELFAKYPALLEYLSIERGIANRAGAGK